MHVRKCHHPTRAGPPQFCEESPSLHGPDVTGVAQDQGRAGHDRPGGWVLSTKTADGRWDERPGMDPSPPFFFMYSVPTKPSKTEP
jgi:hypothetical protein